MTGRKAAQHTSLSGDNTTPDLWQRKSCRFACNDQITIQHNFRSASKRADTIYGRDNRLVGFQSARKCAEAVSASGGLEPSLFVRLPTLLVITPSVTGDKRV